MLQEMLAGVMDAFGQNVEHRQPQPVGICMPGTSLGRMDAMFEEPSEACDESHTPEANRRDNQLQTPCGPDTGDMGSLKRIRAVRCH